ncbi:MAG: type II toxin-antitoxin system RelE/ParE family toxin [Bacilli bacterium]|nr:type II toxin-antitoxin system RelE/ParE family toxin [Bacilli bacterium]
MSRFRILYSDSARDDISAAVEYIALILSEEGAAERLLGSLEKATSRLSDFPESSPLCLDEQLKSRGIRCSQVSNYLLFYYVNQEKKEIRIIAFLHSKRDYANLLLTKGN